MQSYATITAVSLALTSCATVAPHDSGLSTKLERALDAAFDKAAPWRPIVSNRSERVLPTESPDLDHRPFVEGRDDADSLMRAAQNGDAEALLKLEYYVRQCDPKWENAIHVYKIRAITTGEVAQFYAAALRERETGFRKDIEHAIRNIAARAGAGSWKYAFMLYRYYGDLVYLEVNPEGAKRLSAFYLEIALQNAPSHTIIDNCLTSERYRTGDRRAAFPHTPKGWKPKK